MPLVLTEADSHLGLANRLLARARPARLPRVPDRRARGRALPRHRPPGARGGARGRPRARPASASGSPRTSAACSSSAAASARARSTRRRSRRSRRTTAQPRLRRPPRRRAAATIAEAERARAARPAPERYILLEYEPNLGDALAASDLVARPGRRLGLRDRRRRPARDPRPVSARDRRPPARERRAGWREAGAAIVDRRRRARRPSASRDDGSELLATTGDGSREMARGVARRWRAPTRPSGSPPRCSRRRRCGEAAG